MNNLHGLLVVGVNAVLILEVEIMVVDLETNIGQSGIIIYNCLNIFQYLFNFQFTFVHRCIEVATGGVVADALCDPILQPADLNSCHLPCPGECVVSQWSEWSQCSQVIISYTYYFHNIFFIHNQ